MNYKRTWLLTLFALVGICCFASALPIVQARWALRQDIQAAEKFAQAFGYEKSQRLSLHRTWGAVGYDYINLVFYAPITTEQISTTIQHLGLNQYSYLPDVCIGSASTCTLFLEQEVNNHSNVEEYIVLDGRFTSDEQFNSAMIPYLIYAPKIAEWKLTNSRHLWIDIWYAQPREGQSWRYKDGPLAGNILEISFQRQFNGWSLLTIPFENIGIIQIRR